MPREVITRLHAAAQEGGSLGGGGGPALRFAQAYAPVSILFLKITDFSDVSARVDPVDQANNRGSGVKAPVRRFGAGLRRRRDAARAARTRP